MLVIGPNVGAQAAGRNLARFADLLAPEGPAMLKQIAAAEQALTPDCLCAELVYMPPNPRSANVVIRPSVRPYEITLGSSAGVPASRVIPLDELVVRVERDRFYVRWPTAEKRVAFFTGHMLNPYLAPAIVRFLEELSHDGRAALSPFNWEQAEGFPFLPRVQAGRIVLRPAQWRLRKEHLATSSQEAYKCSLQSWRAEWNVPKHVCLSFADNRLVIDLDDTAQAAELRAELLRLPTGGDIIVQEVLPALDEAWLRGPRDTTAVSSSFRSSYLETRRLLSPAMLVLLYLSARRSNQLLQRLGAIRPGVSGCSSRYIARAISKEI